MIALTQETHNLIGSKDAISKLANKDHARLLVMSDSHGNYRTLVRLLKQYGPTCDAFLFCGDGARDIAEVLELANEDEEFRKCLPEVIAFVRGNGDPEMYPVCYEIGKNNPDAAEFPKGAVIFPLEQYIVANNQQIIIVHGHYEGVDFGRENLGLKAKLSGCTTACYGHTHVAREENMDGIKFINPGSCARPRGGQPAGIAILTVEKNFIDTAFIRAEDLHLWTPIC